MATIREILDWAGLPETAEAVQVRGLSPEELAALGNEELAALGIHSAWQRARLRAACAGWPTAQEPRLATRERPFVNAFGMLFVPIPRFKTLFSIIPVRACDYASFSQKKLRDWPDPPFLQEPDHPAVMVNWKDAVAFTTWMTEREHRLAFIPENWSYRLPTDLEWSAAVGLPMENEDLKTPRARSGKLPGFPWGHRFPPPPGVGNYSQKLGVDDFKETSPVASFPANKFGIHDLGGNVWEWCIDTFDDDEAFGTARGASCFNDGQEFLMSSRREPFDRDVRQGNLGFRVVLSATPFKKPASPDGW